jgi:UDP-N-acetyl-D-mannosaminuronate dehydrogenase
VDTIRVHGLGDVGLSTAVLSANAGREVAGSDPSERVPTSLAEGRPRVSELELAAFAKLAHNVSRDGAIASANEMGRVDEGMATR